MKTEIWSTDFTIQGINRLYPGTMLEHLGISFTEKGDNYLKATMPVDHRTVQPYGILHGGASCVLAETLGSYASTLCLPENSRSKVVGVEINANHLCMVDKGIVTGTVTPVKLGRKIHVWQIEIHDDEERLICISRLTVMII